MKKPAVFLSSTFYDLRQIRADLRHFIEDQLGYTALISELPSFPVDPDADTIENCKRRVQENADLFILVIGGRYGSIPEDQAVSVTNMEYSTARAKGIPIYAFVESRVLSNLPTWRDNPDADFTSLVDSTALFEFVSEVRAQDRVWTFPFETAQDIIEVLRNQLAFLMNKGLEIQTRLRGDPDQYKGISGTALRLAIDTPPGWQGKLFAQLLRSEIYRSADLKREFQLGINFGPGEMLAGIDAFQWMGTKAAEATRLTDGVTRLVNGALNQAFAASSIQEIAFGAREVGKCYEESLRWSLAIRKAAVDDDISLLRDELSLLLSDVIEQIEALSGRLEEALHKAITEAKDHHIVVKVDFIITAANVDVFERELEAVKARYRV